MDPFLFIYLFAIPEREREREARLHMACSVSHHGYQLGRRVRAVGKTEAGGDLYELHDSILPEPAAFEPAGDPPIHTSSGVRPAKRPRSAKRISSSPSQHQHVEGEMSVASSISYSSSSPSPSLQPSSLNLFPQAGEHLEEPIIECLADDNNQEQRPIFLPDDKLIVIVEAPVETRGGELEEPPSSSSSSSSSLHSRVTLIHSPLYHEGAIQDAPETP